MSPRVRWLTFAAVYALLCTTAHGDDGIAFAGALCKPGVIERPPLSPSATSSSPSSATTAAKVRAKADEIIFDPIVREQLILRGNASLLSGSPARGAHAIYADEIVYHSESHRARADNATAYNAAGDKLTAASIHLTFDDFHGQASQARMLFVERDGESDGDKNKPQLRARTSASAIELHGEQTATLQNAAFSTCAENNDAVQLTAKQIKLDFARGIGAAKSIALRVHNAPIFYFPYLTFPIDGERKSGFLFPSYGYDDDSGWLIELPHYFNLAPNYDATLTPRLLSKRGAQFGGQFRYLIKGGGGELRGEVLPGDNRFDDRQRYALHVEHHHRFATQWRASLDWHDFSDVFYSRDFKVQTDEIVSDHNASYAAKIARAQFADERILIDARVASYDSLTPRITANELPHQLRPQIDFSFTPPSRNVLRFNIDGQLANFEHRVKTKLRGQRMQLTPTIGARFENSFAYFHPSIAVHHLRYSLDEVNEVNEVNNSDNNVGDDDGGGDGNSNSDSDNTNRVADNDNRKPSVTIPIYSLAGGIVYERQLQRFAGYTQTLEPQWRYVAVPRKLAQNALPNFDGGYAELNSFARLFRANRFIGGDRIGDGEQLTLGVRTRIVDQQDGAQKFSAGIAQAFYFRDREVTLPDVDAPIPDDAKISGVFIDADFDTANRWRAGGFAKLTHRQNQLDGARLFGEYAHNARRAASLGYYYERARTEQLNLGCQIPLGAFWQLDCDFAQSLDGDGILDAQLGLGYDGCCWAMRAVAQRYLDDISESHQNRLLFTVEFADLGRIGLR